MGVLEDLGHTCQLSKYKSLGVLARTSSVNKEEIEYEFLDYYPEEDNQEFHTCEWAVCGFTDPDKGDDASIEDSNFEVICLFWEQEAADAMLALLKQIGNLPTYIEEE